MSIRFAAANRSASPVLARVLTRLVPPEPANDTEAGIGRDQLLRMALRHFADYGLAAAPTARDKARAAYLAQDRENYLLWLAICRTLDRRMADATQRNLGQHRHSQHRPGQRPIGVRRPAPRSF